MLRAGSACCSMFWALVQSPDTHGRVVATLVCLQHLGSCSRFAPALLIFRERIVGHLTTLWLSAARLLRHHFAVNFQPLLFALSGGFDGRSDDLVPCFFLGIAFSLSFPSISSQHRAAPCRGPFGLPHRPAYHLPFVCGSARIDHSTFPQRGFRLTLIALGGPYFAVWRAVSL